MQSDSRPGGDQAAEEAAEILEMEDRLVMAAHQATNVGRKGKRWMHGLQ